MYFRFVSIILKQFPSSVIVYRVYIGVGENRFLFTFLGHQFLEIFLSLNDWWRLMMILNDRTFCEEVIIRLCLHPKAKQCKVLMKMTLVGKLPFRFTPAIYERRLIAEFMKYCMYIKCYWEFFLYCRMSLSSAVIVMGNEALLWPLPITQMIRWSKL